MKNIKKYLLSSFVICSFSSLCYSQNYYEEANKAFSSFEFNKAVELFSKSIENKEELAKSYLFRGAAKIFLRQTDEALKDLDQSKQLDPSNVILDYYYGKLYYLKRDAKLAIEYFNKVISKAPDAAAYSERAEAKFQLKDFKGCITDQDAAIIMDSTREYSYALRGFAKVKLKKYEEAVIDLNTSLRLKPNKNAYTWRGIVWSFTNKHENAIDDYSKALAFDPKNAEVYCYRGIAYSYAGKKAEACADLKKSYELGFADAEVFIKNTKCD
ncbi:tetratricopeptide repeat protein [Niastella caeni]|uniref:Tetratricopeptide repeat protein n=1 Tax=Niastella caeni TaxID=2569763 RepID=A0A4V4H0V7_9BACT|nr:tetratricopeptide repeat protein [Niastella caeni]THU38046.1 tetratricopeptide repeat protein [Niastella caeni]